MEDAGIEVIYFKNMNNQDILITKLGIHVVIDANIGSVEKIFHNA